MGQTLTFFTPRELLGITDAVLLSYYQEQHKNRLPYPPTSDTWEKHRGIEQKVLHKAMNPEYTIDPFFMGGIEYSFRHHRAYIEVQTCGRWTPRFHRIRTLLGIPEQPAAVRREMVCVVNEKTRQSIQSYLYLPLWMESLLPKRLAEQDHLCASDGFRLGCTEFNIGLMAMGYKHKLLNSSKSRTQIREEKTIQEGVTL